MKETAVLPFMDELNAMSGLAIAILTMIFGKYWFLFAAFFGLNVLDFITGCMKARINNTSNSSVGSHGVLKKLGYWIMILVAFGASAVFIEIGEVIGVNLGITTLIGWYVLATLIVNEFRSIIENFVEAGYDVPEILTKGLEVASKKMHDVTDSTPDDKED